MYRVVSSTDSQHIGECFDTVESGNILTFADGDVVPVDRVYRTDDDAQLVAISDTYMITFAVE